MLLKCMVANYHEHSTDYFQDNAIILWSSKTWQPRKAACGSSQNCACNYCPLLLDNRINMWRYFVLVPTLPPHFFSLSLTKHDLFSYVLLVAPSKIFGRLQACCGCWVLSTCSIWWSPFCSRSRQSKEGCTKWTDHSKYSWISWTCRRYKSS